MMQRSTDFGQATLNDYLSVLRRRKWIIIQATVVVTSVAVVFSLVAPKVFQASAAMLIGGQDISAAVTGLPSADAGTDPVRRVQTQAKLARVPEVARRAVANAGVLGATSKSLLEDSTVKGSPDSDFLTFTVKNGDARAAARLATAYANAYAGYALELDTRTVKLARSELEKQVAILRESGDTKSALFASLVTKAQQLRTMELLQQRNAVVKPAETGTQVAPAPMRSTILGLLVGILFGTAIAFLWEALDRRVRSEGEVEQRLNLPILSRLPEPPRHLRKAGTLAMIDEPTGIDAEAVRRLRTNVEFANLGFDSRMLMVTSAMEGEGKSTTVANLAVALARSGRRIALIDLDLRKPTIAQLFGHRGFVGITNVALGQALLDEAIFDVPLSEEPAAGILSANGRNADSTSARGVLGVLPAGQLPPSPGEFVGTAALAQVLDQLRDRYDLVLIDAPPMCVVGDAMTLSAQVDALIVVTRLNVLQKEKLRELRRELSVSPVRKLGIVICGADFDESYNGGYGYFRSDVTESRAGRAPTA